MLQSEDYFEINMMVCVSNITQNICVSGNW